METAADLRSRVVALEQTATTNAQRLTSLETWQRQREVAEAGKDAEWRAMIDRFNERFSNLETKIGEIAGTLKFLSRTFVGAIILAIVAFLVRGGFHIP